MATHSSILAWEIPWTEEPGGLQSMGSQRVELNAPEHTHITPWSRERPIYFLVTNVHLKYLIAINLLKIQETITWYSETMRTTSNLHNGLRLLKWNTIGYQGNDFMEVTAWSNRTGSKLGEEYIKALYCHLAYLTYMQSTSWEILDWMKHKLESRFTGEISITSDMQMTPHGRNRRRSKEPRWKWKRRVKKLA